MAPTGEAAARAPPSGGTDYGIMVASGSPAIAEAVAASGVDWLCIDAQHGAVTYEVLGNMIAACSSHAVRVIVRVGGPNDRFGIQQALDLGAHGIMVPLVNSRADAEEAPGRAARACSLARRQQARVGPGSRGPPTPRRRPAAAAAALPAPRAVYHKGVGGPGLSRYLREANSEVEVWLQVETRSCFEAMDDILSVPGITSAFLGPCDLGITYGLHVKHGCDIGAMIASKDLAHVYDAVLQARRIDRACGAAQRGRDARHAAPRGAAAADARGAPRPRARAQACDRHGITPGVFCLGEDRAAELGGRGFRNVAYDTDLGAMMAYTAGVQGRLKPAPPPAAEASAAEHAV
ncbi:rhmA [Scenedesmus sp. PABB004]|nr:rhmA [Scenedesmus sp. PABB004]